MKNLNRVTIIGQLTANPEKKVTSSGKTLTTFNLATNYSWKEPSGDWKEGVDFHKVVAWGKLGEYVVDLYKKGEGLFLEGKLRSRSWKNTEGATQRVTEIVASNVLPVSSTKAKMRAQQIEDAVEDQEEPQEGSQEESTEACIETEEYLKVTA